MAGTPLPNVFETARFVLSPCRDCDVPGYLILQPRTEAATFAACDAEALEELGQMLARAEAAILAVTGAEHVYVLRFSEGLASVHFHLFARTAGLAAQWTEAHPALATAGINGPLLFAWARVAYFVANPQSISAGTRETASRIGVELARQTGTPDRFHGE